MSVTISAQKISKLEAVPREQAQEHPSEKDEKPAHDKKGNGDGGSDSKRQKTAPNDGGKELLPAKSGPSA